MKSPVRIVQYLDDYLDRILDHPRGFGSLDAVEGELFVLLQLRGFALGREDIDLHRVIQTVTSEEKCGQYGIVGGIKVRLKEGEPASDERRERTLAAFRRMLDRAKEAQGGLPDLALLAEEGDGDG